MTYFSDDELKCKSTGIVRLADGFLDKLNKFRKEWDRPLKVNSCCRSKAHNASVGGKERSFHIYDAPELTGVSGTCAIDISTDGWVGSEKAKFVNLAISTGWSVGVAKTFLHIDRRADYPTGYKEPVLFTY